MYFPIVGARHINPSGTVYASFGFASNGAWDATETNVSTLVANPAGITVTGLAIYLLTAPGGAASRTFTVFKNGSATALAVTVTGAATSQVDTTTMVAFAKGDLMSLRATDSGSPASTGNVAWYSMASGEGQTMALLTPTTSGNATHPVNGSGAVGTILGIPMAAPGSFSNAVFSVSSAPGVGNSYTYTLFKNGVSTSLACVISGTNVTVTDSTHHVSFAAGDYLYWKFTAVGGTGVLGKLSAVFTPSVNGTSVISSSIQSNRMPSTSATQYNGVTDTSTWTGVENTRNMRFPACTAQALYVKYSVDPAGTASWTNFLRKNTANTSLTTVVSAGSTTAFDASHTSSVSAGDIVDVSTVPANTPAAGYVNYSIAVFITPGTVSRRLLGARKGGRTTSNNVSDLSYYGVIGQGYGLSDQAVPNTVSAGATQITTRAYHVISKGADFVRLVYPVYMATGSIADTALPNANTISGAIQRNSTSGHTVQDGQVARASFSGASSFTTAHGYGVSDPIRFPVRKNERVWTRNCATAPTTNSAIVQGFTPMQQLQTANTGDGYSVGDLVSSGTVNLAANSTFGYAPFILGYFPNKADIPPAAFFLGDSIGAATGESGMLSGYLTRAARSQYQMNFLVETQNPYCASVNGSVGGQFASQWIANNAVQLPLACMFTTWVNQLGTHDIGDSLALAKSRTLSIVQLFVTYGIPAGVRRFVQCTLIPKMTSTDAFLTIANQTQGANYTERYQFNDWVRDTGPSGFKAQAMALGATSNQISYFDAAYPVTVDSNNRPTTAAGFWRVPSATAPSSDYTVANSTGLNTGSQRLTPATIAAQQDRGWVVNYVTGPALNQPKTISWSQQTDSNTTHNIKPALFSISPNVGDTARIYPTPDAPQTIDGTHGMSASYALIAASSPPTSGPLQSLII